MPNQPKKPTRLRLPLEIHPGAEEDVAGLELAGANLAQQQAHGLAGSACEICLRYISIPSTTICLKTPGGGS